MEELGLRIALSRSRGPILEGSKLAPIRKVSWIVATSCGQLDAQADCDQEQDNDSSNGRPSLHEFAR